MLSLILDLDILLQKVILIDIGSSAIRAGILGEHRTYSNHQSHALWLRADNLVITVLCKFNCSYLIILMNMCIIKKQLNLIILKSIKPKTLRYLWKESSSYHFKLTSESIYSWFSRYTKFNCIHLASKVRCTCIHR